MKTTLSVVCLLATDDKQICFGDDYMACAKKHIVNVPDERMTVFGSSLYSATETINRLIFTPTNHKVDVETLLMTERMVLNQPPTFVIEQDFDLRIEGLYDDESSIPHYPAFPDEIIDITPISIYDDFIWEGFYVPHIKYYLVHILPNETMTVTGWDGVTPDVYSLGSHEPASLWDELPPEYYTFGLNMEKKQ